MMTTSRGDQCCDKTCGEFGLSSTVDRRKVLAAFFFLPFSSLLCKYLKKKITAV